MEEGQLTAVDSTPIAQADPSLDSLTNDQLQQKIGETLNLQKQDEAKSQDELNQAIAKAVQPEAVVTPPAPAQPAPQTTQTPAEPKVEVHAPEQNSAFAELQAKKGLKTPDELAVIYKNLQKDYTKKTQELANLKKNPVQPNINPVITPEQGQQIQAPVYQGGDIDYATANEAFKQSLQTDPIGTLAQAIAFIQERSPQAEMLREQALSQEAIALASNPKTADFTSPEITQEIQTILSERPNEAVNLEKNLKRLFHEARGRVQDQVASRNIETGKQIQEQNILNKKNAVLESGNGAAINNGRTTTDPNTMPIDDLYKTILKMAR